MELDGGCSLFSVPTDPSDRLQESLIYDDFDAQVRLVNTYKLVPLDGNL